MNKGVKLKHAANLAAFIAGRTRPSLGPVTAMWDITYLCNYRCLHCNRWEHPDPKSEMNTDRAMQLVEELAEAGINLRGFSAAVVGKNFVLNLALDSTKDANKATRVLKAM